VAEESGRAGRIHSGRISWKQRLHLAAVLTLLAVAAPLSAQSGDDIDFDPAITQEEFSQFSRLVAQGIYATPVEPARARGLLGFDIGVAATALPVDTNASYWTRAVGDDFTVSDYVAVPRLVVSKGLSVATIAGTYSKVQGTDIEVWGGSLDLPIISGGIATPALSLRGAYSQLKGVEEYDLKTYGVELFLSKGFGPLTPYIAAGRARSDAEGRITIDDANTIVLTDESETNRYTVGLRLSLLLPKIVIEATQAEERSYAAKVSFGF
jgi:hypothetical protein